MMSDFLSGFSEKKKPITKDDITHQKESPEETPKSVEKSEHVRPEDVKEKDVAKSNDEAIKVVTPSVPLDDELVYLRDEPTEFDPSYKKKKAQLRILIGAISALLIVVLGVSYYFLSSVKVPDFSNLTITEVRSWANENRVVVETDAVFSNDIDTNVVVEQETVPGKRIKKGSTLRFTLSKGADPDEVIGLVDFKDMSQDEIYTWIESNHISSLKVTTIYDKEVEKGQFIRIELLDKDLLPENFKRKDAGTIFISKGEEIIEKNIAVLDFKSKTQGEVETWHATNKFLKPFVYEEAYSDTVDVGMIISQSISKDELVGVDDVLTFVVSKGKALIVPNYSGSNKNTFESINTNGIAVAAMELYSDSVPYGGFISQSSAAGTNVTDSEGFSLRVYYSIGKPYIQGLVGKDEGSLQAYFFDTFESKGAKLTYVVQHRNSCEPKGIVFEASHDDQFVPMNAKIWVTISSGNGSNCDPVAPPEASP